MRARPCALALAVAIAACSGRERCPPCPPTAGADDAAPPIDAMTADADPEPAPLHPATAALVLDELSLTIALDAAYPGRVGVRVVWYGAQPLEVALPDRLDQVAWHLPGRAVLATAAPHLAWSAWHPDSGRRIELPSRTAASQRPSRIVTLAAGRAEDAEVDLGPFLAAPRGADDDDDDRGDRDRGEATRGWCARAWLLGGAAPVASNVVCWPR